MSTIVYSEGRNLTLVKGKDPEQVIAEIVQAQASDASFLQISEGGSLEHAGSVWVKPSSVTALISYESAGEKR